MKGGETDGDSEETGSKGSSSEKTRCKEGSTEGSGQDHGDQEGSGTEEGSTEGSGPEKGSSPEGSRSSEETRCKETGSKDGSSEKEVKKVFDLRKKAELGRFLNALKTLPSFFYLKRTCGGEKQKLRRI